MAKIKKTKQKKQKKQPRKAVKFGIRKLGTETIKAAKQDRQQGIKQINNAMRLIGSYIKNDGEFILAKNAFARYQRIVNKAKCGISIEDSAFESLVKVSNPMMYIEVYIKPNVEPQTDNDDNDNNKSKRS